MGTKKIWRGLVCAMVLVPCFMLKGQETAVGARSASMAGISAGLEDSWSVMNNPAGLARYNHLTICTNLEQRYFMKELGYYALALSVPASNGCIGIATLYSGYQAFTDQKFRIGYGRLFGEHILSGISLVYVFQRAGNEARPVHQVSYELGAIVILSNKINLAFSTFNPFQLYYRSEDYATLPAIFRLGLSYHYATAFFLHTELEKDLDLPPILKIGLEYIFRELFYIRAGIQALPASYSFGIAIRHQRFLFEFASSYHFYLGFTPQVSLQFDFK
jgi:hypothetical protein